MKIYLALFLLRIGMLFTSPAIRAQGYTYTETLVKGGDDYNLVTRIYLPEGEGPWPVVITRTPYAFGPTTGDNLKDGQKYARRGLGYIQQYCRGKVGSEGIYEPNIYEREDGLALVNWVAGQSWCRSIGLFGVSYTALTGWIIADSLPDKVKGIYLHLYGIDRHLSAYKDGLFRQDILTAWAIDNASEIKQKPPRNPERPYYDEFLFRPHIDMDTCMLGIRLPWYHDWITHTDYNDAYWDTGVWGILKNIPSKIKVPVKIVAGWFDHHLEGTLKGYELLAPEIKKHSSLVVGAWDHYYKINPDVPATRHAKDIDVSADQLEWLYKVVALNEIPEGNVQVYHIKADEWKAYPTWPIESQTELTFHLSAQVNTEVPEACKLISRSITEKNNQDNITDTVLGFRYDPENPVMSVGGETLFSSSTRRGSLPQPPVGYRDDILFSLSEPLPNDFTITGPIKAILYVASDCEDTSFTYKVSEIEADGTTHNIRSGITTLAYRNNRFGSRQTYQPGLMVELKIETLPITWQIKSGNRIRIDITSSNFPEYSVHTNYPGPWAEQTATRVANQSIYISQSYPSRFIFPGKMQ